MTRPRAAPADPSPRRAVRSTVRDSAGASARNNTADSAGDGDLVLAILGDAPRALPDLLERHGTAVFGVASAVCGPSSAVGVTQEVFARAPELCRAVDTGRPGSLRAVLCADAHRLAVSIVRAARLNDASSQEWPTDELSPEAGTIVAALPAPEREAILLSYLRGHTYREVAVALGTTDTAAKRLISDGLRRLRVEVDVRA